MTARPISILLRSILCFATLIFTATGAGCASHGEPASENKTAVSSLESVQKRLASLDKSIEETLKAAQQLRSGEDLRKTYKSYGNAVADVESDYAAALSQWKDMRKRGAEYVKRWQEEVTQFESEPLKTAALERRDRVAQRYEDVRGKAMGVQEAYLPFAEQLAEIDRALALDPTPAMVRSIDNVLTELMAEGTEVRRAIQSLQGELGRITAGMTPEG